MEGKFAVKFHSYRSARASDIFLRIPREWVKDLEIELCKAANISKDNHVTFEVASEKSIFVGRGSFRCFVVTFSDGDATFGREIQIGVY